jgi:hypothetical protein
LAKAYLVYKGAGGGGGELLAGREPRARVEGAARFGEQAEEEGALLLHARLALGVVGGPHAGTHRGHLPQHLRVCLRAPACLVRATHSPRPSAPEPKPTVQPPGGGGAAVKARGRWGGRTGANTGGRPRGHPRAGSEGSGSRAPPGTWAAGRGGLAPQTGATRPPRPPAYPPPPPPARTHARTQAGISP